MSRFWKVLIVCIVLYLVVLAWRLIVLVQVLYAHGILGMEGRAFSIGWVVGPLVLLAVVSLMAVEPRAKRNRE